MEDDSTSTQSTHASPSRTTLFKEVVLHFSPAWFAVNMGTGAVSSLFHSYPYGGNTKVMNAFALVFFFLNLTLFIIFLVLSILRYVMIPHVWSVTVRHPVQSLYFGTFPMGAATIIDSGVTVVYGDWGFGGVPFLYVLWALWWLDCILSFLCCFGLVWMMTTRQRHSMSMLTPLWLLPVLPLIVASAAGQLLANALIPHSRPHAFLTIGMSIIMVVIGVSLVLMILTLYLRRLLIDGLPEVSAIVSSFIPLGPCGKAGYSLLIAGQNLQQTLPWGGGNVMGDPLVGRILNIICFFSAFILWSMGIWWLVSAIIAVIDTLARERIPFKLAFWALVFPNGVQALLTIQLATALDARLFRVLGAIHGATVLVIWLALAVPTLMQVFDRSIFHAPGLEDDLMKFSNDTHNGDIEKNRTQ